MIAQAAAPLHPAENRSETLLKKKINSPAGHEKKKKGKTSAVLTSLFISGICVPLTSNLSAAPVRPQLSAMFSLRLLKANGVLLPDTCSAPSETMLCWTVELSHGTEKHRTQFATPASSGDDDSDSESEFDSDDSLVRGQCIPWHAAVNVEADRHASILCEWPGGGIFRLAGTLFVFRYR